MEPMMKLGKVFIQPSNIVVKKMKILITGSSGFIGKALLPQLKEHDHEVYLLERYVTGRYLLGITNRVFFADLRDYSSVHKIVQKVQPEAVIHLASISPVSYSYNHPQEVFEVNALGTINLAEACLHEISDFKHFLFAGTSEEYGNQDKFPITEDAELRPNSPYSVSKVAADKYLQYMHAAYGFPVTILRPFNTYGREDNTHFVVERTITQMLQSKTVGLGDPTPTRDFLYVTDHVHAYLACLDNPKAKGDVFNFCTGHEISIKGLVELISELTGFKGEIRWNTIPVRPLDIKKLVGSYEKAKRVLGWEPKISLKKGLKKTVDFWRSKISPTKEIRP
jgi:nucleoside-diphosphate-sugar epimerase